MMSNNPFSTRYFKPGVIDFVFPPGINMTLLKDRMESRGFAAAIIGPHGSGKTTLARQLVDSLRDRFQINWIGLEPRNRFKLERARWRQLDCPRTVTVIDGYEQLSMLRRWQSKRKIERSGGKLIVTTHGPVSLPTLMELNPSERIFWQLVQNLQGHSRCLSKEDADIAFRQNNGNMREAFMSLYDVANIRLRSFAIQK